MSRYKRDHDQHEHEKGGEMKVLLLLLLSRYLTCLHSLLPGESRIAADDPSVKQSVFTITENAHIRAFSWLKVPTRAFTFKTLLRHYEVDMKLGRQHNYQAVSCK